MIAGFFFPSNLSFSTYKRQDEKGQQIGLIYFIPLIKNQNHGIKLIYHYAVHEKIAYHDQRTKHDR